MGKFKVTDKHLKLLQNAYVSWSGVEYGAPEINPKRPYGNSDVTSDIIKILFGDLPEEAKESLADYARELHEETETALQICLYTQKFETGMYESTDFGGKWKKVS